MSKQCKWCESTEHTQFYCKRKLNKPIKKTSVRKTTIKPAKKKPKTKSRGKLVKELDQVFSLYIRLRDDLKGCVTCGVVKPYKEMQACHFYSRGKIPTRWDEDNVFSGCYRCNVLLKGNYINYTRYMIDKYGREFVDQLEIKANSGEKITTQHIKDMTISYKSKVLVLKSRL